MLSPMMQHYLATKEENKDCILFYRLGDFYEMFFEADVFGMALTDVSTGAFFVGELPGQEALAEAVSRFDPAEILCNEAFFMSGAKDALLGREPLLTALEGGFFRESRAKALLQKHFHVAHTEALGLKDRPAGLMAAGGLLAYLEETQKNSLAHINQLSLYHPGAYMLLDAAARRNLELTETLRDKERRGSLLWVLDKTGTAMGARQLRSFIEQPLLEKAKILARLDALEELNQAVIDREEIREYLRPIYDLERLLGRLAFGHANARDLVALGNSLEMVAPIKAVLALKDSELLREINGMLDPLEDITALLKAAIVEDPPLSVKEGGIIRPGYSPENDRLQRASTEGKDWLLNLEREERDKSGIKNLRIKFNKVFGYYFEVTNSYKDQVPDYFIRRQTLVNAERYTTPQLKEMEDTILGAQDKSMALEYQIFTEIRDKIVGETVRIQQTARGLALLDALSSLALVAERNRYVRPSLNEKGVIHIREGRHPVVEKMLDGDGFTPNDTYLDGKDFRLSIITGPNMAGKSTYMRQTALIVLMAQMGSFVPAAEADIGLCDRIFTRVGASDDLASGQSTFMVEMTEVANILRHATPRSLVILDEIGRGTSTFDGLSIAWAVVEHMASNRILGCRTLFATHYHELTELEGSVAGVHNYCVAVKEQGDSVIFLRKIIPGGADKSYGIQVARLAGLPESVLKRARDLLEELSDADISARARDIVGAGGRPVEAAPLVKRPDAVDRGQLSLFGSMPDDEIIKEIEALDLEEMTPKAALNTLYRLQNDIRNRS